MRSNRNPRFYPATCSNRDPFRNTWLGGDAVWVWTSSLPLFHDRRLSDLDPSLSFTNILMCGYLARTQDGEERVHSKMNQDSTELFSHARNGLLTTSYLRISHVSLVYGLWRSTTCIDSWEYPTEPVSWPAPPPSCCLPWTPPYRCSG